MGGYLGGYPGSLQDPHSVAHGVYERVERKRVEREVEPLRFQEPGNPPTRLTKRWNLQVPGVLVGPHLLGGLLGIPPSVTYVPSGPPHVVVTVDTYKTPRSLWSTSGTNMVFHPPRGSTTPVSTHHLHHHGESSRFPRKKVVHLQIQAYESSTVDRKEMIHKAGFVDPGQLTFSHGGVWWVTSGPWRAVNPMKISTGLTDGPP